MQMKNLFKALLGSKNAAKGSNGQDLKNTIPAEKHQQLKAEPEESQMYSLSVKVASVMGESVYAEYNGVANTMVENRILEHFSETDYLDSDEIPIQFKMCKVFFHKLVDIHEASAIMSADQEAQPSANTRIDEKGGMICYPTDVKNCQSEGKISWPGGSIKLTRILMPSVEDNKYHLVIINS
jgi:hypothetical protein